MSNNGLQWIKLAKEDVKCLCLSEGSQSFILIFQKIPYSILTFRIPWLWNSAPELLQEPYPVQMWAPVIALRLWFCGSVASLLKHQGSPVLWLPRLWLHLPTSIPLLLSLRSWNKLGAQVPVNYYGNFSKGKLRMDLSSTETLVGQGSDGGWHDCVFIWRLLGEVHVNFKSDC